MQNTVNPDVEIKSALIKKPSSSLTREHSETTQSQANFTSIKEAKVTSSRLRPQTAKVQQANGQLKVFFRANKKTEGDEITQDEPQTNDGSSAH